MNEPEEYSRYRRDAQILVEIGRSLGGSPSGRELPEHLADAALAAWQRDESAEPLARETPEQIRVRHAAATLALVGLEVESARREGSDLALHPETVADAMAAASEM